MSLFLGVDGGNTKTIAIVATADGRPVGCGRAGPSDIYNAPTPALAIDEIARAVEAALDGRDGSEVAGACFSLAGADWPEDIELLRSELGRRLGIAPPAVVNDAIGALRAGTSDGRGVSVVIGTYTAIGAGLASGEHWHVSFWGEPVYGFDLSRMAIDAAVRSQLGILPTSALCDLVPLRLGCTSVEDRRAHV